MYVVCLFILVDPDVLGRVCVDERHGDEDGQYGCGKQAKGVVKVKVEADNVAVVSAQLAHDAEGNDDGGDCVVVTN